MLKVFENRVLRKIFGPKTDQVTGKSRRLRKQELNALYSSANVIRVITLKRLRWAWHVASMGRREMCTGFRCGDLREKEHFQDLGVDGRTILKWIFKTWDEAWTGLVWLRIGTAGGFV